MGGVDVSYLWNIYIRFAIVISNVDDWLQIVQDYQNQGMV